MSDHQSSQHSDQAAKIKEYKSEVMRDTQEHRPFVNAGAPSHGVMKGEDMKNASDEHVEKVEVCGYDYKGYNPKAWKY